MSPIKTSIPPSYCLFLSRDEYATYMHSAMMIWLYTCICYGSVFVCLKESSWCSRLILDCVVREFYRLRKLKVPMKTFQHSELSWVLCFFRQSTSTATRTCCQVSSTITRLSDWDRACSFVCSTLPWHTSHDIVRFVCDSLKHDTTDGDASYTVGLMPSRVEDRHVRRYRPLQQYFPHMAVNFHLYDFYLRTCSR